MDFAIGIGRTESMHEIGDHARVAEESGFKHLTIVDIPYLGREVDAMMTMAALNTKPRTNTRNMVERST